MTDDKSREQATPRLFVIHHRSLVIDHFEFGAGMEALELHSLSEKCPSSPSNDLAVVLHRARLKNSPWILSLIK